MVWSDPVRFGYCLVLLPKKVKDPSAIARRIPPPRPLPALVEHAEEGLVVPWKVVRPGSPALEGVFAFPAALPEWKVTADSFQPGEGDPENAIDGDPWSMWHTSWSPEAPVHPHHLVVDFVRSLAFTGIRYTGRRWNQNGRIADYEVFVSEDGKSWGEPVARGRFENRDGGQDVRFASPVTARFLKLVALSEVNGKPYASVAGLELIQ